MDDILYSRNSDEWSTPDDIFKKLDAEFKFNLDPCATKENAKCQRFFTKKDDGLKMSWGGRECSAILRIPKSAFGWRRLTKNL